MQPWSGTHAATASVQPFVEGAAQLTATPWQWPAPSQRSCSVQRSPSSQLVPSAASSNRQAPCSQRPGPSWQLGAVAQSASVAHSGRTVTAASSRSSRSKGSVATSA